jgi:hypothetical protein
MGDFQFPVYVRLKDCGEVRSYRSVADMQYDFEEIDVENGEYEAWDAKGTPVKPSVQNPALWLRLDPEGPPQPEQLANAIAEFARLQNVQADTPELDRGNFSKALEGITAAIRAKRKTERWWHKLKRRF